MEALPDEPGECGFLRSREMWRLKGLFALFFLWSSCGIPDVLEVPSAPISSDSDSTTDNQLSFTTPADSKIDRYIIWYKIYPWVTNTATQTLVNADYTYFKDLDVRSPNDIRKKDFHELQLGSDVDDGYYFEGIGINQVVLITRNPGNTANYITLGAGGRTYNVRRNVATSVSDNARKPFYGDFDLDSDVDIRNRKSSDFSSYSSINKSFSVAFMVQSAYVNSTLTIVRSPLTPLGIIYSSEGFEKRF
ncbi:MAG: hypothetical protein AAF975_05750 [Spirochaetota bacterium]